jgi:glycosyltransferase domain-containing protein
VPNKSGKFKKLTIVMASYGRRKHLIRSMNYWSGRGPKVLVMDGDSDPIDKESLLPFDDNIVYKHLPKSFLERLKVASEIIDTKYAIFHCDDEFFLPSGLSTCINFLEKNPDYSACIGRALGFYSDGQVVAGRTAYPRMSGYELSHNNNSERLLHLMRDYSPHLWYSVVKSDVWRSAINTASNKNFLFNADFEIQFHMCVAYSGKSCVLPILMWLRSYDLPPMKEDNDNRLSTEINFPSWYTNNSSIKQDFINNVVTGIIKYSLIDNEDLKKQVSQALSEYYKFCIYGRPYRDRFERSFQRLRHLIPLRYRRIIRSFFLEPKIIDVVSLKDMALNMNKDGVKFNLDELNEVILNIDNFNTSILKTYD